MIFAGSIVPFHYCFDNNLVELWWKLTDLGGFHVPFQVILPKALLIRLAKTSAQTCERLFLCIVPSCSEVAASAATVHT